jgi:hypothetical protein
MATSTRTLDAVVAVMLKHMTPRKAREFLHDLMEVRGSKSFRETLIGIEQRLRTRHQRGRPRADETYSEEENEHA